MGRIWVFGLLFFMNMGYCFAQSEPNNISFNYLSVKHGLSQNGVMAIFKDSKGFMWFGTRDGLNRYDGYTFEVFRHNAQDSTSISNNYVRAITEDANGILWIGTEDGLNSFDRSTEKFKTYKNHRNNVQSLSENAILSLLCSHNGDLWVGTENGLNLKKKDRKQFQRFINKPNDYNSINDNHIYALFQDSRNNIWIGTRSGGLNRYDINTNGFEKFTHDPKNTKTIGSNFVMSIAEAGNGTIWVGTSNGLSILQADKSFAHIKHIEGKKNTLSNNTIRSLAFDNKGNLWIATYQGLNRFTIANNQFQVYKHTDGVYNSISHDSIRSLFFDENGFLWIGTYFGGINVVNQNAAQFSHFYHNPTNKKSIGFNIVGSMSEDDKGNIYVGTEGGGLYYFNKSEQSFSPVTSFSGKKLNFFTIKSTLFDSKKRLWVGTYLNGLYMMDLKKGTLKLFSEKPNDVDGLWNNAVTRFLEDGAGRIWIGTDKGLNYYDPGTETLRKVRLGKANLSPAPPVTSLFEDAKKTLWVGTKTMGLIKYTNGSIKYYNHNPENQKSISNNSITSINEDAAKRLWIGTYGGGLNLMNRQKETFEKFMTRDGLENDIVYELEIDDNNKIWIATPTGISKFDYPTKTFRNYNPDKGLPIEELNERSALKHSDGTIFMGGSNGLLSFHPRDIKDNALKPQVVLKELKLFNKIVTPGDESGLLKNALDQTKIIEFKHTDNVFTIEYTAFNYPLAGSNQYAYKLEGFEENWNYVGSKKTATYTNLDPGYYTFKVKVANDNGVWSENEISLGILKHPPFWKTAGAYLIYTFLALLLFFIIRRYLLLKLSLENSLKLEKLEKSQLDKHTKLKLSIFTNISHDFRTPLSLIHAPLQEIIKKTIHSPIHHQLLLINKNVALMLRLVDQLMDFRRIESEKIPLKLLNEPLFPFVKEIICSFKEFAKTQNIKYTFTSRLSDKPVWFDRSKLEKVLYNVLSNAFKYTPDEGKITVEICSVSSKKSNLHKDAEADDFIEIKIKNTGPGINKKNLEKIFDHFYQENNQDINTQPGTGIGLAIAKGLIELHKGYINVQSEAGNYTEFIIGLPLNDIYGSEDKLAILETFEPQGKMHPADFKNSGRKHEHTLMIVEDNSDLRDFIQQSLATDYEVIAAKDGIMALDLIDPKNYPSVIISDIMMPKMSGFELCKQLKANPKTSHIPVILLTARTSKSTQMEGYEIGADDFMSKPFSMDLLRTKIKTFVKSKDRLLEYSRKEVLLNPSEINTNSADDAFLQKLSEYIRDNIEDEDLNVSKAGKDLGMSRVHLYRKIKSITGKTPVVFIRDFRLAVAAKLLEQDNYNINEVCYKVGFQDIGYFRKCFKRKYNLSAIHFLKRGRVQDVDM